MKRMLVFGMFGLGLVCQAEPRVDSLPLAFEKGANGDTVKISYVLTGQPAVVTVDLQTNTQADASGQWVSIGGRGIGELQGEANRIVRTLDTVRDVYWFPSKTFYGQKLQKGGLRAVVQAWPTNCPPDYMVVDLTAPTNVIHSVRFYASRDLLPGGFDNDDYKTTKLLMRKIPAAGVVWRMGTTTGEKTDVVHKVMFTDDYYAGVYEVTQGQYFNIAGDLHGCLYADYADSPKRAFQEARLTYIRGQVKNTITGFWPENGHTVTVSSVMGILRAKCGIDDMDIPTEAQWEYAARAGTGLDLPVVPDGKVYSESELTKIAWYQGNAEETVLNLKTGAYDTKKMAHVVGMKDPNAWGLYDMIGNVFELCLDRFSGTSDDGVAAYKATFQPGWETGAVTTNPVGVTTVTIKDIVKRGGGWYDNNKYMKSGGRCGASIDYYTATAGYIGFRLFCSVRSATK